MKILIVHQFLLAQNDAGGSRWNQFAKHFAQSGHHVTVLAGTVHYATGKKDPAYRGKFIVKESPAKNLTVLRCHVNSGYNKNFLARFFAYLSFALSSTWAGLFYCKKHDVIITSSPPLSVGITGWILGLIKRTPVIFEVRDLWPDFAIDTGVLKNSLMIQLSRWLEKSSYQYATHIVTLTPAFKNILIHKKNIPPNKITTIPNAADLDLIQPATTENHIRTKYNLTEKFVVTYVGAHGVANHLLQLLETAKILKDHDDIRFLLIGDGMQKPMLKKTAQQWNLHNLLFIDSVPKRDITNYLAASDICTALLKKCDAFKTVYPNKLFDYFAAKRPVILAIDGAARELIKQADAGLYVEPENPTQFAQALLELKNNPKKRNTLAQNGYNFVKKNFNRPTLAKKYLHLLNQLTTTSRHHNT